MSKTPYTKFLDKKFKEKWLTNDKVGPILRLLIHTYLGNTESAKNLFSEIKQTENFPKVVSIGEG